MSGRCLWSVRNSSSFQASPIKDFPTSGALREVLFFFGAAAFRIRRVSWSQSLARLTLNSRYVRLNSNAGGAPSRCNGTTHCGNTRCRIRACGNESRTRPTRVAHLCFAPPLPERKRYEKRKAPRDDRPAEFQYCLRAWLSRQPRRMGAPHGSSCEAVNDLNYCHHQGARKPLIRA